MRKKFKLHPTRYAIGQTENFYTDMAAKGWILEKRGEYLSRFRSAAPQITLVKAELSRQDPTDEGTVQIKDLYEESGWTFVTRKGLLGIFSAPIGTPLPKIPEDPARTAAVRKEIRRNGAIGLGVFALCVLGLFMAADRGLLLEAKLAWYTDTAKMLFLGSVLTLLLFDLVSDTLHAALLYSHMGKGWADDKGVVGNGRFRRTVILMLISASLAFGLLAGLQLYTAKKYDMPAKADGPYMLLSELGWMGKRTYSYQKDNVSSVTHVRSLLSEQWYTREYVEEQPDGAQCMLLQEIYRLQSPKEAMEIVASLMSESVFAKEEDEYSKVEVPGLDAAWMSTFEYIAVKDRMVYYLICLDSSTSTPAGPKTAILSTLAKYRS